MTPATSFKEVLDLRGRILLFTPNAIVGLRFEQMAERNHATVVCTRGWVDKYAPLQQWHRLHAAREYAVLSCDQYAFVFDVRIPATDVVWVGHYGDPKRDLHTWMRFSNAMGRAGDGDDVRLWTIGEQGA